jgi:broad specificity phosphatase PhoE
LGARSPRLVADHDGRTVVIATHGGLINASLEVWLGLPPAARRAALTPTNASITEWSSRPDGRWQLDRYNDTAHLGALRFSE